MADLSLLENSVYSNYSIGCRALTEITNLSFDEIKGFYPFCFVKDAICEEWCLGNKELIPLLFLGASKDLYNDAYKLLVKILAKPEIMADLRFSIERYSLIQIREIGEELLQRRHKAWDALRKAQKKDVRMAVECDFESSLVSFLSSKSIQFERQLKHGKSRFDIVVPGELIIEIKAGRVTGDDACQALDYLAFYKLDVLLVGSGLSSSASRAIEAANKISQDAKILFVTEAACFSYLRDVLS